MHATTLPAQGASALDAVDLFAGFGGLTLGAEQAGVNVKWVGNHDQTAVRVHALNHPGVIHACQDLRQADWSTLPPYRLLLSAPACQGHSRASQPRRRSYHDAMRATAFAVIDCADVTEPDAIIVENVPSFTEWRCSRGGRKGSRSSGMTCRPGSWLRPGWGLRSGARACS